MGERTAWYKFRRLRFRPAQFPYTPEDAFLYEARLYSIDAYLAYWVRHNMEVIDHVPDGQLLIVPMTDIERRAGEV